MNTKKIAVGALFLVLVLAAGYWWQAGLGPTKPENPPGPPEKITVGTAVTTLSGLLYIAQDQSYDKKYGLKLELKTCPAGKDAISQLQAGQLEVACCAEYVLVRAILDGARDLRCLGVLCSGSVLELVARRDRGINRLEDLRGKTIGVPPMHAARFFLGRFLALHHIPLKEIKIVDISRPDSLDALAAGKVDAVMVVEPRSSDLFRKLGGNAVVWPAQGGQDLFWLLVTRQSVIQTRGAALEKLLQALARSAAFTQEKPEAARKMVDQWLKVPLTDLEGDRLHVNYRLFLDQGLLLAMEDEARWIMVNRLTEQTKMPDFLDYLYTAPLAQIAPNSVRIILPRDEKGAAPPSSRTGEGGR
jgi:NitT/TauT family transport system substrate-binding protein